MDSFLITFAELVNELETSNRIIIECLRKLRSDTLNKTEQEEFADLIDKEIAERMMQLKQRKTDQQRENSK